MDVLGSVTKIDTGLQSHIRKVKIIQQQYDGQPIVGLQELLSGLIENRNESEEIIRQLNSEKYHPEEMRKIQDKIRILEEKEKDYQKKIEKLMKDNESFKTQLTATQTQLTATQTQLTATQTELTEFKSALHTRQIACQFENDLAKYIYPATKKYGSREIFTKMRKWVNNEEDETPERLEAEEKWKGLKRKYSWLDEYNNVFDKLIKSGNTIAHPKVLDSTTALTSRSELEKRCIEAMKGMTDEVNKLMK